MSQGSELSVGWAGQVFTMFRVNIVTMLTLVTLVTLHRENMVQVITAKSQFYCSFCIFIGATILQLIV